MTRFQYILFYKPYGVICQFSPHEKHPSLAEFKFPKNVYPVGRLDTDSEGLLILTDDGDFQHRLIEPRYGHARTYHAQVEGIPNDGALDKMRHGILLDGKPTLPARVTVLEPPPDHPIRNPPIRYRKNIPTTWVELVLTEGRNRQVRRMTAAAGFPTLRLLRVGIMSLSLEGLQPGSWRAMTTEEFRSCVAVVKK
ncbi:pseudouridine synthase [bacterium]|nr:pseudouridine synthase [bacterium]NUN46251.1 pseudouridine synthase [bacterium]